MAKEVFQTDSALSKKKLGRLLLIGSIKKALGVSFHEKDWPIINNGFTGV